MSGILQALVMRGSSPIQFVGVGAAATSSSNSIGVPSGVQAGDLLIIACTSGATHTLTATTGWTQIVNDTSSGSTRVQAWWKIAGSSEAANSVTSAQSRMRLIMVAYRNNAASPVDVAPSTVNAGNSTSASTASLTTTAANDLIIGFATSSNTSTTYTAPASVNERYNAASTGTVNGMIFFDEIQAAVGSSTARTVTLSLSSVWRTYAAAFKQA